MLQILEWVVVQELMLQYHLSYVRSYQLIYLVTHSCCSSISLGKKCHGQLLRSGGGSVPTRKRYWSATLLPTTAKLQLVLLHNTRWHCCLWLPYMVKFYRDSILQNPKKQLPARMILIFAILQCVCRLFMCVTHVNFAAFNFASVDQFKKYVKLIHCKSSTSIVLMNCVSVFVLFTHSAYLHVAHITVCYCSFVFCLDVVCEWWEGACSRQWAGHWCEAVCVLCRQCQSGFISGEGSACECTCTCCDDHCSVCR